MSAVTLVRGRWVLTGDDVLFDAAVAIEDGKVLETGDAQALTKKYPAADRLGDVSSAVLPGFVNAHHHSHGFSTIQNGWPDLMLESWILGFAGLRSGPIYEETLLSAANQLRSGVTSLVDVHSGSGTVSEYGQEVDDALRAYETAGIRVAFATGSSTQSHLVHGKGQDAVFLASLPDSLREAAAALLPGDDRMTDEQYLTLVSERVKAFSRHEFIDVWFAPPGPQWVSDEHMQAIAVRAGELGTQVQTHCNESYYEKLHRERLYGCPTVLPLDKLGVLDECFSIAHGVWLTGSEIEVLAATGAAVSHNPSSNLRLRAGIAPLNALLKAGASVALGMDGTTINEDEDMFAELRLALRLNRAPHYEAEVPTVAQLYEMATHGGARLMDKGDVVGRIAPGYAADLMLLDLERVMYPWVTPEADPLELITLRAQKADVRLVLVAGEVVVRDGRVTGFDEREVADALVEHLSAQPLPTNTAAAVAAIRPHMEQ